METYRIVLKSGFLIMILSVASIFLVAVFWPYIFPTEYPPVKGIAEFLNLPVYSIWLTYGIVTYQFLGSLIAGFFTV